MLTGALVSAPYTLHGSLDCGNEHGNLSYIARERKIATKFKLPFPDGSPELNPRHAFTTSNAVFFNILVNRQI